MSTNYILHLNNSFRRFNAEEKATPFHISLYMALFHKWNGAKFRNPISVARDDVMRLSKIGSANTYSKCLKELHTWGYIKYMPSHSYHVGSKIYMYTFNTTTDTTTDTTSDTTSDKTDDTTTDTTGVQDVRPYINNNKQLKNKTNNIKKGYERAQKNNCEFDLSKTEHSTSTISEKNSAPADLPKGEKKANKKNNGNHEKINSFQKPTKEELRAYFTEKGQSTTEAEKFFNYFESNGWLVGGRTPMKNWIAAANNWILNSKQFALTKTNTASNQQHPAGKLHTETNKNYDEPL